MSLVLDANNTFQLLTVLTTLLMLLSIIFLIMIYEARMVNTIAKALGI